jgi:hypothetical protein
MKEEFNLSEKIVSFGTRTDSQEGDVRVRDVKEFIRLLKKELKKGIIATWVDGDGCIMPFDWTIKQIDKLAGEKLINS